LGKGDSFGFFFSNNLGMYEIGDSAPLGERGTITVVLQRPAQITLIKDSSVVAESETARLTFIIKEPGAYRTIVSMPEGTGRREWIRTQPIRITSTPPVIPASTRKLAPVAKKLNLSYVEGSSLDKQKLDIFPSIKTSKPSPVLFFVHGGYWRGGDRSIYRHMGEAYANEGITVVIPSYRLQPGAPHPAQIEDVAAAFAWTVANVSNYGGDPKKIHIMGHSAGGHLVSLLASNPTYLAKHALTSKSIASVISISGLYDVRRMPEYFGTDIESRTAASPLLNLKPGLPPFLILWAHQDYPTLPMQARIFNAAADTIGVKSTIRDIPQENHVSIMRRAADPSSELGETILKTIR
jgi:acetyl esterase/lipase